MRAGAEGQASKSDEPDVASAQRKPAQRSRDHERHVQGIARDREERKKRGRRQRNVENSFTLIGNVLLVELFFAFAMASLVVFIAVAWVATGELPMDDPIEFVAIALTIAVLLPLLLLMKRRLRSAPAGIALTIAIVHTLSAIDDFVRAFSSFTVSHTVGEAAAMLFVPILIRSTIVGFHWFAFATLRRHKSVHEARAQGLDASD